MEGKNYTNECRYHESMALASTGNLISLTTSVGNLRPMLYVNRRRALHDLIWNVPPWFDPSSTPMGIEQKPLLEPDHIFVYCLFLVFVHFDRPCIIVRYTRVHLFQNDWYNCLSNCRRVNRRIDVTSISGMLRIGYPIWKCPEVSASRSCGSVEADVSSREFITPSIRVVKVLNSSYDSSWISITRFRWNFMLSIATFYIPPNSGEAGRGRLKCHLYIVISENTISGPLCHWTSFSIDEQHPRNLYYNLSKNHQISHGVQ